MGAFGERLRREREMRGISLEEIVATTKIGTRLLRALENEQFDLLPGGIFNKSYVRAYAKCVGIDEDEAVAAYMEAAQETPPDNRVIAHQHASIHSDRVQRRGGFPIVPVLILIVVIAAGWGGWRLYQDRQHEREINAAVQSAAASTEPATAASSNSAATQTEAAPAPSQPASPASESARTTEPAAPAAKTSETTTGKVVEPTSAAAGAAFEVVIRPKEPAWVSVKSDGKFVVRGIIRPPDVKTVKATDQVVFWTGNAGAVEVSFDGKNVPLPGDVNQEGVLVFNSRGVVARRAPPAE